MTDYNLRFLISTEGEGKAEGAFSGLGSALGNVATIAGGILAAELFKKIGEEALGMAKDLFASAVEAEDANVRLEAVLKATGETSGITAQHAEEYAEALQLTTAYSDEAIKSGMAIVSTFDKIKVEAFDRTVQAGLDIASTFGVDVTAAMRTVAKALQDPGEGLAALQRLGIRFTEAQQKLIDKMVKTGDVAGAQSYILDELESRVGGVSQAMGETASGSIARFNNRLDEMKETLGAPIVEAFMSQLEPLFPLLDSIMRILGKVDFSKLIPPWLAGAAESVRMAIGGLLTQIEFGGGLDIMGMLPPGLADAFKAVSDAVGEVMAAFAGTSGEATTAFQSFVDWFMVSAVPGIVQGFQNIAIYLSAFAAFWREHGPLVISIVSSIAKVIVAVLVGAFTLLTGIYSAVATLLREGPAAALANLGATFTAFFNTAAGIVGENWETFKATWVNNWNMLKTITMELVGRLYSVIVTKVVEFIKAGQEIVAGIKKGIQDAWAGVVKWFEGKIADLVAKLKAALRIKSPSGVFADIGTQMAEGIRKGFGTVPLLGSPGGTGAVAGLTSKAGDLSGVAKAMMQAAKSFGGGSGAGKTTTYNLTANYGFQDERRLRDDIRLLQLLNPGA